MQKLLVAALSASLLVPSAVLAGNGAALPPGKPAGVRGAQTDSTTWLVSIGAIGLLAGIAAAASNCCQHSNTPVPAGTSSTTV